MEDFTRRGRHEFNLASRKAEEAALRRYQATHWLDCLVGPLGISSQPTEKEFISCLRNGLLLCNFINKIQPGSVPKVVENHSPSQPLAWDSQPLPAYQYFENIRNFLVAVEPLKLPAFEASVFERDNIEIGSSAKVVDCILALKAYHEWKQMTGGRGLYKPPRSPLFIDSARRINTRTHAGVPSDSCRRLDMSAGDNAQQPTDSKMKKLEDLIVKALADRMIDAKENMDSNFLASFHSGNMDPVDLFSRILSGCLEEKFQNKLPELKSGSVDTLTDRNSSIHSVYTTPGDLCSQVNSKCCRFCLTKERCHHWGLVEMQEKELSNLKALLSTLRKEFENLQSHIQSDLKEVESQVHEMSTSALGYHKVVKENRTLYNMVQDLKGNIRVYCRVRPAFSSQVKNVIDFIGEDGSLVVVDPLKLDKDGRKVFQFNRVFGPAATQDEVFREIQPLIRSVMDGFNACIFAYGQTGSGKTYTMYGPPGGSANQLGINYLALDDLFRLTEKRKDAIKYDIHVQMVEIYNEQVRDLLAEDFSVTKLELRSCANDSMALPNATKHSVKAKTDVLNLMKFGEVNRAVGSTSMNNRSSRSHSILTIHVRGEDVAGSILRSCLHLVDLAGSERVDKSEVTGEGLKEAQFINKSLSCLGDVIMALAQKSSHIPYRNSKLTLLLQNFLGGHAKTLMLAHVSPEMDSFGETISTLKFAQKASTVELGAAHSNKDSSEILELKAQIENLKRTLAGKVEHTQTIKPKEAAKTPIEKSKAMAERTPPRTRRLSIENCSTTKSERTNFDQKKEVKSPPVQPRSRRLSLEGPRYTYKDNEQTKGISKPIQLEVQYQDSDDVRKPYAFTGNGSSRMELDCRRPPRSPTSSVLKNRMINIDQRTKISSPQLPKTPEPPPPSRNEVYTGSEFRTPGLTKGTNGKGSQIKKSIRTIGKLLNGSDKRNQQKLTEAKSPLKGSSSIQNIRSPVPSSARPHRRQSLTGIQPPERSRRSSLGGNSNIPCPDETRNAKTPPPVHPDEMRNAKTPPPVRASAKLTKRWM